jgi:hypothetical protein
MRLCDLQSEVMGQMSLKQALQTDVHRLKLGRVYA